MSFILAVNAINLACDAYIPIIEFSFFSFCSVGIYIGNIFGNFRVLSKIVTKIYIKWLKCRKNKKISLTVKSLC